MARLFLPHSSGDNAAAAEPKAWLDEQGFALPFLISTRMVASQLAPTGNAWLGEF